jgi:hypothetical protein
MRPVLEEVSPVGCDESAYSLRERGYSPEPIRDAAWEMAGRQAAGRVVDIGSGAGGWIERLRRNPDVKRVTTSRRSRSWS